MAKLVQENTKNTTEVMQKKECMLNTMMNLLALLLFFTTLLYFLHFVDPSGPV